jgi:hypothetical protein
MYVMFVHTHIYTSKFPDFIDTLCNYRLVEKKHKSLKIEV